MPDEFSTAKNTLRAGMVGMGMIFDETYRPFFEQAHEVGVYSPQFGLCQVFVLRPRPCVGVLCACL